MILNNKSVTLLFVISLINFSCQFSKSTKTDNFSKLIDDFRSSINDSNEIKLLSKSKRLLNTERLPTTTEIRLIISLAKNHSDLELLELIEEKLIMGGINQQEIQNILSPFSLQLTNAQIDELVKKHHRKIDIINRNSLEKVKKLNFHFNHKYHRWRTGKIKLTETELVSEALKINSDFSAILNNIGFPSEDKIGYFYENGKIKSYHDLLLIHTYQRGELVFIKELDSLFANGYIDQYLYKNLKSIRGFGDSSGIENEMKLRFKKFNE